MIDHDGVATLNHVKRALIYVHYNKNDELSEYVIYQLEKLKHFYEKIVILSNSKLTGSSLIRLEKYADAVIQRNNIGFDFAAWRDGIRHIGWETLETYDELTFMNDTCFGPIRDMSTIYEQFNKNHEADFWGITNHREEMNGMPGTVNERNPLGDPIPKYIQTYFIAFKNRVIKSEIFQNFWNMIEDYTDIKQAIIHYETQLTKLLENSGYKNRVLVEAENIEMPIYAPFHNICLWTPDILLPISPFIKRKAFVRNKYASQLVLPRLEKIDYPLRYVTEYIHSIDERKVTDTKAKLIVLRGNSGSGKTTIARRLKEELFYNVMVIGWDTLRIDIFNRFDYINRNKYIFDTLSSLSEYGRKNNFTVIIEGIYPSNQYKSVLTEICKNFPESHFYYFDISFEETLRRHNTKNQTEFGVEELRKWHIEGDSMNIANEKLINEEMDEDDIVAMIINDVEVNKA
jgi:guanylate kinase